MHYCPNFEIFCRINTSSLNLTQEEYEEYEPYTPYFIVLRFSNYLYQKNGVSNLQGELYFMILKDKDRNLFFSSDYIFHNRRSYIFDHFYKMHLEKNDFMFLEVLKDIQEEFEKLISKKDLFEFLIHDAFLMKQADIEITQEELENKLVELEHYKKYI